MQRYVILLFVIPLFLMTQPIPSERSPEHHEQRDWSALIDSFWGPGLPTETKLQIFDTFWTTIDTNFACFNNLVVNWDSLRTVYRAEIQDTVSRGRFAAIMNYLALALKDGHTVAEDIEVNYNTDPAPGVPLLTVGGWGENGHFGAGLTPLPDSSLLVYRVVPVHPLGLEPGDIVLGYDGIPWKTLYKDLMAAQLPLLRWPFWWGSSDSTLTHSFLMSAGLNWHLFDTIDVAKYSTGDTVHLATAPLVGQSMSLYCTEQLDVPGVPMPDIATQSISYGIIDGTRIGYIYAWMWWYDAEDGFYDALYDLTSDPSIKGLIIDSRFNLGGGLDMSNKGLQLLFRDTTATICFLMRSDPHDHFAMRVWVPSSLYVIPGNGSSWYSKPIAVLTGPGAISAGDHVAFRMTFHPTVRIFGKSTSTAFGGPISLDIHSDWFFYYSWGEASLANDTTYFLTHRDTRVDVPIWLTRDDVAQGDDTVVRAAMAWIDSVGICENSRSTTPTIPTLRVYPNPCSHIATIEFSLPKPNDVSVKIYNVVGQEVTTLVSGNIRAGRHIYHWDASTMPSGVYFCRVTTDAGERTAKMTVIK